MLKFLKRKKGQNVPQESTEVPPNETQQSTASETSPPKSMFDRLRQGLSRTRSSFTDNLSNLLLGKKKIDEDLLEALETQLILADLGVDVTQHIITELTNQVSRKELKDSDALYEALQQQLQQLLQACNQPLDIEAKKAADKPFVILMVGVNGNGKTTTIGKLAHRFQQQGKSVMLAAGDTFRAAAVEQLQIWGERNNIPVIAQQTGADSASVIYDAVQAATARNIDVVIADTAGRLHTQTNLMDELKKIVRVTAKLDPDAPHEIMLVIDAGTGQNALRQAQEFNNAVGITGLTLTKLDGTAKGGAIFAIAKQVGLPIRFLGVGESLEDLKAFDASEFVKALFATTDNPS